MSEEKQKKDILKWIIISLTGFAVIILIFGAGMIVGGMKARFSYSWAESYHKNFAGPRGGFLGDWRNRSPMPRDFIEGHGAFGEIIEIKDNEFVIKRDDDIEKVILISDKTIIQKRREKIKKENLRVGDFVVVIGSPNKDGKIEAKMIRIFEGELRALPILLKPQKFPFF